MLFVLGFVITNQRCFISLVSKSVDFIIVFSSCSADPSAWNFACFAAGVYADYTIKTNEKSTFLGFGLFYAFEKTFAFGVRFAYISQLEIHVFLEDVDLVFEIFKNT